MLESIFQLLKDSNMVAGAIDTTQKASSNDLLGLSNEEKVITPSVFGAASLANLVYNNTVPDLSKGTNFQVVTSEDTTRISNPINAIAGMSGVVVIQIAGGDIVWDSFWDFGAAINPSLPTVRGSYGFVYYTVLPNASSAICISLSDNTRNSQYHISKLFKTDIFAYNSATPNVTVPLPFTPNLVWQKGINTSDSHALFDSSRNQRSSLSTNTINMELSVPTGYGEILTNGYTNSSTASRQAVGYSFKKSPYFFDIVSYTGDGNNSRAVAHNLAINPGMVITKRLDATSDWWVYHPSLDTSFGTSSSLKLNTASGVSSAVGVMSVNDKSMILSSNTDVNQAGGRYISYLFANDSSTNGNIKCGQYIGTGSGQILTVDLGWEPQFILIKNAFNTGEWSIVDNKRSGKPYTGQYAVYTNATSSHSYIQHVNFIDNGFQTSSNSIINVSGNLYVYMAIRAE